MVKAWSRQTSLDPDQWTPDNPAWGQGAVTALLVRQLFGFPILRTTVMILPHVKWPPERKSKIRHYLNRGADGQELDLTFSQFPLNGITMHANPGEPRVRMLPFGSDVHRRVFVLRKRVNVALNGWLTDQAKAVEEVSKQEVDPRLLEKELTRVDRLERGE